MSIIETLKQKKGPLPIWAWAAIGGGAAYYFIKHRNTSSPPNSTYASNDTGGLPVGISGGGGGGDISGGSGGGVTNPVSGPTPPPLATPIVEPFNGSPAAPTYAQLPNYTPPSVNPMQLAPGVTQQQAIPFLSQLTNFRFQGAQLPPTLDNVLMPNQQGNLNVYSRSAPGIPFTPFPGAQTTYFRPNAGSLASSVAAPTGYSSAVAPPPIQYTPVMTSPQYSLR